METEEERPICDEEGLLQKLEELKYEPPPGMRRVPFVETLAIVADPTLGGGGDKQQQQQQQQQQKQKETIGVADDIKREAFFVQQVQHTVPIALARLRALGLQFTRPEDFLAEMLKTDQQMGRIRARIEEEQQQQQQFIEKMNPQCSSKLAAQYSRGMQAERL
ncbi:uncharacterized protein EMH_0085310 [Eimeria mitis]|uniref:Uncharacterized protein n=1 Tax=Eimeria mitis TaxID=44415 RepID=U6KLW5_9EIME|nr:uncharacterized protein EMH_0085310 [Eimeria mitis]CDJ36433.1 hypothetical protein, conserved [Eimeria mitis]